MTIRYDRPVSLAAILSRRLGQFAFVLLLVTVLSHRFGLMDTPYFVALALMAAGLAALAALLAITGLVRLWQVGAEGGVIATKGLFYAIPPLVLVCFGAYLYVVRPPLYDISTDVLDPPPWLAPPVAAQLWLPPRPIAVAVQDRELQMGAYPALTGRRYEGAIDRVYLAVKKVADQQGFHLIKAEGLEKTEVDIADMPVKPAQDDVAADAPDNVPVPLPRPAVELEGPAMGRDSDVLLQSEIRTFALGLRFDVVIRLREELETTSVDLRIASRYGPHDLGLGADIADQFLRALDAELLGIAGG